MSDFNIQKIRHKSHEADQHKLMNECRSQMHRRKQQLFTVAYDGVTRYTFLTA